MADKTVQEHLADPAIQRKFTALYKEADEAMKMARTMMGSPVSKVCSTGILSTYAKDVARVDKCMSALNLAQSNLSFGRAKNTKELIKAYGKFIAALEVLDQANFKFAALISAGLAATVAALITMLRDWEKATTKRLKKLDKELKEIWKLVGKAEQNVTGAQAQLVLNTIAGGIFFSLGPVGWGARIAVTAAGMTTHLAIDAALGPSAGSMSGTMNTAVGTTVELYDRMADSSKKLTGALTAIVTLKMDISEIGQAKKELLVIRKRLTAAVKEYNEVLSLAQSWKTAVAKQDKLYNDAISAFKASAKQFKSSQKKREQMLKEFAKWK